ncbi:unnamed protein product [Lymnaea stagnalis]|uniref:protein-tyrosine-phosphatase n=1 Tax=Lymnaea stagnalis TaxID=6523 RepID=A0AAV2HBQ7_LYMST
MFTHGTALVALVILIAAPVSSQTDTNCTNNWFGSRCQYLCHCMTSGCGRDGQCQDGCARGWFGPQCQYVDIARNATTVNIWIKDGDDSTCYSMHPAGVPLNWSDPISFTWMRLQFKNAVSQEAINVKIYQNTDQVCTNPTKAVITNKTVDVYCEMAAKNVTYLNITSAEGSQLCSVYISGGRNIALKQNTTQAGTYIEPSPKFTSRTKSENAVDGNRNSNFDTGSCTHTDTKESANWTLTFALLHYAHTYVLYNREGRNADRLQKFQLVSYDTNSNPLFTYRDNGTQQQVYRVRDYEIGDNISSVTITANHRENILTLCEVEIYGDVICSPGYYGPECDRTCNCEIESETCFVSTGVCPSGCPAGYIGERCQTRCDDGFYGKNCLNECSEHCSNLACNVTSGACSCKPGYQGNTCLQACGAGFYGTNCLSQCSKQCRNEECNHTNGYCSCKAGYRGDLCTQACPETFYGQNCSQTCSVNCTRKLCNTENGQCNSCIPGKTGQLCDLDCSPNCGRDNRCHQDTRHCLNGCLDGYAGDTCEKAFSTSSDTNVGNIVGPVIAAFILVAIVVAIVIILRKRKEKRNKELLANGSVENITESVFSSSHVAKDNNTPKVALATTVSPPDGDNNDELYYNTVASIENTSIALDDLNNYMLSHSNAFFEEQFKKIPSNVNATVSTGQSTENSNKNRYKNIIAYDHSRVHLVCSPEKKQGDYINASFVKSYKEDEKFIASQGPSKIILEDFVRMLWEQNVEKVIMLTNLIEEGKHKCERYWPSEYEVDIGEIKIRLNSTHKFADYIIRKLELLKPGETTHALTQFHFTSWPDKGVPTAAWGLVDFQQRVLSYTTNKPIVVHCSAGVGRTGTFIALHNVVCQAKATGTMDFFKTLCQLRQDRVFMVQTALQYIFLHKAAQVAMLCIDTTVHSDDIVDRIEKLETASSNGQSLFEQEFKAICHVCADDDEVDEEGSGGSVSGLYQNSRAAGNKLKNRFSNILPKDQYRPYLSCDSKDSGDYINAVFIHSFTKLKHQFLTQLPLSTTVVDFWRLVTQFKVSVIIAFELDLKDSDETIGSYLPPNKGEILHCGNVEIEVKSETLGSAWEEQSLAVAIHKKKKTRMSASSSLTEEVSLTHFKYTGNFADSEKLLTFIQYVRLQQEQHDGRILYTCRNGADLSGFACILSLLLDRMDNDHYLTVPLVVGAVKTIRHQVIPTLDQYKALYNLLKLYITSDNIYCNFADSNSTKYGKSNPGFVPLTDEDVNVYANN